MVFVHSRWPAGVQFRGIQRGSGRLRLGLGAFRVHCLPGLAGAGARGAARATAPDAGLRCSRPVCRRTPAHLCSTYRPRAGMKTVVIPASAPFDEVLAAVAGARPTHLVGYATVIGRLARAALAGELEIRPLRVSTNSEPLLDEDRQAIRDAWNAPVHNLWGSTEIGVQAVGCGRGEGLHVCEDEVVLERVDEQACPSHRTSPRRERSRPGWPTARFRSSATTSATRSRCCPDHAHAEARSPGWPTSPDAATTTSATGQYRYRRVRFGTFSARTPRLRVPGAANPTGAEVFVVGDVDVERLILSVVAALCRRVCRIRRLRSGRRPHPPP